MNTRIGRFARHQSCLGGFAPSPSPKPVEPSSNSGDDDDDDDDDDASCSETNDEMTASQ